MVEAPTEVDACARRADDDRRHARLAARGDRVVERDPRRPWRHLVGRQIDRGDVAPRRPAARVKLPPTYTSEPWRASRLDGSRVVDRDVDVGGGAGSRRRDLHEGIARRTVDGLEASCGEERRAGVTDARREHEAGVAPAPFGGRFWIKCRRRPRAAGRDGPEVGAGRASERVEPPTDVHGRAGRIDGEREDLGVLTTGGDGRAPRGSPRRSPAVETAPRPARASMPRLANSPPRYRVSPDGASTRLRRSGRASRPAPWPSRCGGYRPDVVLAAPPSVEK